LETCCSKLIRGPQEIEAFCLSLNMVSYKNLQYAKFCAYGFLKNLVFFEAFLMVYLLDKGFSYTLIASLYTAKVIATNLMEIPSGLIADTYGRKTSLLIAFALFILAFYILYAANAYFLLLIAMIIYGLADAFRSGTHKGMIMDYLKKNGWSDLKITYYGGTRSWSQLGSAISSLIAGGIVLFTDNYHSIFILSIIPYVLNFINIASYPNDLNFSNKQKETRSFKGTFINFWKAIQSIKVLLIVNSSALSTAYLKSIKDYIQPMLMTLVISLPFLESYSNQERGAALIGVVYFIIYVLSSRASRAAKYFEKARFVNFSTWTLVIAFVAGSLSGLFYEIKWIYGVLIFFSGIFIVENLRKPVLTGMIAREVKPEILSSVLSVQSSFNTLTNAALTMTIGLIVDHLDIGYGLILTSVTLLLISLLIGGKQKSIF